MSYQRNLLMAQERNALSQALVLSLLSEYMAFYGERDPHFDDEDDALEMSADKLDAAAQKLEAALTVLKEGN